MQQSNVVAAKRIGGSAFVASLFCLGFFFAFTLPLPRLLSNFWPSLRWLPWLGLLLCVPRFRLQLERRVEKRKERKLVKDLLLSTPFLKVAAPPQSIAIIESTFQAPAGFIPLVERS